MMHDLPTPAPSSDAPMPGSSPTKPMRHSKELASTLHRAFPASPFTPLDLNTVDLRVKAFQDDRQKAGATPPPSSPTMSAALTSSPAVSLERNLGISPTKQQHIFKSTFRQTSPKIVASDLSLLDLPSKSNVDEPILGLTPNLEAVSEADAIPHLLFASRSVSLVIGRRKPSDVAHAYNGTSGSGVARQQDQDDPSSTQGLGAKRIVRVNLPNEARHVSRIHAIVEWIPFVPKISAATKSAVKSTEAAIGTFIVRIVGQNGLIVDGKRRREGQVLRLIPGKSVIDFFGVKCRVEYVPTKADRAGVSSATLAKDGSAQNGISPIKPVSAANPSVHIHQHLPSSPPPTSSPPIFGSPSKSQARSQRPDIARNEDDAEDDYERSTSPTPAHRRASELTAGPLSTTLSRPSQRDQEVTAEDDDDESDDDDFVPQDVAPSFAGDMESDNDDADSVSGPAASIEPTIPTPKSCSNNADVLTESQTKMPPPNALTAAVRNKARRSASNSPAPPSASLASTSIQELQNTARRCVRQLAATYDLAGLLAGAIVFHRTATISASEAVRSVLSTTPGLMKGEAGEHNVAFSPSKRKLPGAATLQKGLVVEGWPLHAESNEKWTTIARKAWREHLEVALQSSPMFGVITRAGKDASGNPLEFWYYYDKENDPDKERAENLGVFAKPMRKALKGQKPIFWKRSGYASRQQDEPSGPKVPVPSGNDQESLDIATEAFPASSIAASRKRKAMSQVHQLGEESDGEERKREKLRAKIAQSGLWDETQPEEKEQPTWDRKGDLDYGKSRK